MENDVVTMLVGHHLLCEGLGDTLSHLRLGHCLPQVPCCVTSVDGLAAQHTLVYFQPVSIQCKIVILEFMTTYGRCPEHINKS